MIQVHAKMEGHVGQRRKDSSARVQMDGAENDVGDLIVRYKYLNEYERGKAVVSAITLNSRSPRFDFRQR